MARVPFPTAFAVSLGLPLALVVACGSRGPLDDTGPLDGSSITPDDAAFADEPIAVDASEPPDSSRPPPVRDAEADGEGGDIFSCGSCVLGSCGSSILMCVEDTGCRDTLQCVATTCLNGGTPDLGCVVTCAAGDISGALQLVQIFECVTGTCGGDCTSVLGGLLGGLGP